MHSVPELILASTSPYRRALLARLGLPFRALAPACNEEALKVPGLAPEALAARLALAKAESLRATEPGATIIGSDQVAALDGALLGKPGTAERAVEQLERLAGRRPSAPAEHHHRARDGAQDFSTTSAWALIRRPRCRLAAPTSMSGA